MQRASGTKTALAVFLFAASILHAIASADARTLEPGKPVLEELSGAQERSYTVALPAGRHAEVLVEQQGIDVVVVLDGNGGSELIIDENYTNQGQEKVEVVAGAGGDFQLKIKASSISAVAGKYEIRIDGVREATENDRSLFEARKLEANWKQAMQAGRYEDARQSAEQSIAIAERVMGAEHPFFARQLWHLADYYEARQDLPRAISLGERALAIAEKTLGKENSLSLEIARFLSFSYFETNDPSRAEQVAESTLELSEKMLGPEHALVARCMQTLGAATGDPDKAEQLLKRALAVAEKVSGDSQLTAVVLNQLGIFYMDRSDFQQAEPLLVRSQAIKEKVIGPGNVTNAVGLLNLGMIARQKKDYVLAEEDYRKGIAIIEKAFGPENSRLAMLLNNLANIYRARGEYAKSLEAHLRVLRISEATRGPDHPLTMTSLGNIAKIYAAQADIDRAIQFQSQVDAVIERNIELNLAIGSERQKLYYMSSVAERTDRTISLNVDLAPDRPEAAALAALVLLQRKGRVLDAMSETFASLRRRSTPDERALLEQYNAATAQLANLVLNGPQSLSFDEHQKAISETESRKDQLEAKISRLNAEFRSQSQSVTLAAVHAAIPSDAALIEYAVYRPFDPKAERNSDAYKEPRYVAYVLHQKGDVLWRDLGDAKSIESAIDSFRTALRNPKNNDIVQLARTLDEQIMQPLRPLFPGAKQLFISPDGAVNLIPVEALVDEHNRYLMESYRFTYLTSGRDLLRLQVARESKTAAVVFADPTFGDPQQADLHSADPSSSRAADFNGAAADLSEVYFAPLEGSAREAQAIKSLFPDTTVLTGSEASESMLKRISAPRILHIATHGFFVSDDSRTPPDTAATGARSLNTSAKAENPLLRSGLALAGANLRKSSGDDGILTGLEASGLNLWGTRLVTLSACDTGVGEVKSGEGVYGMRRAFTLAGTETLIMSLWPVSDYVTREMMTSYYAGLKQGLGRGDALRQVQRSMLRRKGREHPYYWAAFIQSGEWANLDGKR